jgi:hypothetical protein
MTIYILRRLEMTCSQLPISFRSIATIPGDKMPRPLDAQLHATKLNEILHLDFLYIGMARDGKCQCLQIPMEGLSGYLWLMLCRTADAAATVDVLMRWISVFGIVLLWISDRGIYFKNEGFLKCKSLAREVSVELPIDFVGSHVVWRLKKPIYGIVSAPKSRFDGLIEVCQEPRLTTGTTVEGLLTMTSGEQVVGVMALHVDDAIGGGTEEFHGVMA